MTTNGDDARKAKREEIAKRKLLGRQRRVSKKVTKTKGGDDRRQRDQGGHDGKSSR